MKLNDNNKNILSNIIYMDNKIITDISLCRLFKIIRPKPKPKEKIPSIDEMLKKVNDLLKEINI
jgi:hypothetical protein